jgi:hypothetical protein
VALFVAAGTGAVPPAYAAGLTVTSQPLGASVAAPPAFYPTSIAVANGSRASGKADKGDTVTMTFSTRVSPASICPGSTAAPADLAITGVTLLLTDNAGSPGNDTVTVASVPTTSCTGGIVHVGTVDLGSPDYITGGSDPVNGSTITLTQGPTSATLTLTLGNPAGGGAKEQVVPAAHVALFTPDPQIADATGDTIGANLARSVAGTEF